MLLALALLASADLARALAHDRRGDHAGAADQPLLERQHRAVRRSRPGRLAPTQDADLGRALGDAQRLEHPVRAVLERIGDGAMTVEQAQHTVDLGGDRPRVLLHDRAVVLVHRRRRQHARRRPQIDQEAFRAGEQLVRADRDLLPPHHRLVAQLEARLGPQQELVQRALPVQPADLRGGDLALEEPDLAAAQPAHHEQRARGADRGQRAHQVEHAEAVAEIAVHHRAIARATPREDATDRDDVAHERRADQRGGGAGRQRLIARHAVADVEHRRRPARRAGGHQLEQQILRGVGGRRAGDHHRRVLERRQHRVDVAGHDRQTLSLEAEPHAVGRARIAMDDDDFGSVGHDLGNRVGV